jgi:hypothetical protein
MPVLMPKPERLSNKVYRKKSMAEYEKRKGDTIQTRVVKNVIVPTIVENDMLSVFRKTVSQKRIEMTRNTRF